jgi:predicted RNA binding protein YcfA (HicA-like mRNA interferase family)
VVTGAEVVKVLKRAGFVFHHQRGSHVYLKHVEERRRVSVPVHSGHDLPPGTLAGILDDAGLTVEQLIALLK